MASCVETLGGQASSQHCINKQFCRRAAPGFTGMLIIVRPGNNLAPLGVLFILLMSSGAASAVGCRTL